MQHKEKQRFIKLHSEGLYVRLLKWKRNNEALEKQGRMPLTYYRIAKIVGTKKSVVEYWFSRDIWT